MVRSKLALINQAQHSSTTSEKPSMKMCCPEEGMVDGEREPGRGHQVLNWQVPRVLRSVNRRKKVSACELERGPWAPETAEINL